MSHPVSGYMIIHNEARTIQASMSSILQYVDELLILDGDSSDGTLFIIRERMTMDPRIKLEIQPQSPGRYPKDWGESQRRNCCASNVTHDWVITIDGDELLDNLPADYFRQTDQNLIFNTLNLLNRQEYITKLRAPEVEGGWLFWYPDPHVRYFNRTQFTYNDTFLHCFLQTPEGEHAIHHSVPSEHDIWHYHAIVNPDRQWDNPTDRQKIEIAPLNKPLPRFDELMQKI